MFGYILGSVFGFLFTIFIFAILSAEHRADLDAERWYQAHFVDKKVPVDDYDKIPVELYEDTRITLGVNNPAKEKRKARGLE